MASEAIYLIGPKLTCFRSWISLCLVRSQWMLLLTWHSRLLPSFVLLNMVERRSMGSGLSPGIWATAQVKSWIRTPGSVQWKWLDPRHSPYQAHKPAGLCSPSVCRARGAEPTDCKETRSPWSLLFQASTPSWHGWLCILGNKFSKPKADRLVEMARPLKCCTSLVLLYKSPACTLGLYNWSETRSNSGQLILQGRTQRAPILSSAHVRTGQQQKQRCQIWAHRLRFFFKILWFQHLPPGKRLLLFVLSKVCPFSQKRSVLFHL